MPGVPTDPTPGDGPSADPQQGEAFVLATLVQLCARARGAEDTAALDFLLVNETHQLMPYRQAALWDREEGVIALSGLVSVENNAPYVQWLKRVCRHLQQHAGTDRPTPVSSHSLPGREADTWDDWLPAHGLWIPIPAVEGRYSGGGVFLAREVAWSDAEQHLAMEWIASWASVRGLARPAGPGRRWLRRLRGRADPIPSIGGNARRPLRSGQRRWLTRMALLLALTAVAVIPVRLSVLAPAQLVPLDPVVIRAPMDGVIDAVLVEPNQRVRESQALFDLDRTTLDNRLALAQRTLDTLRLESRQRGQVGLVDSASRLQALLVQGRIDQQEVEISFIEDLIARTRVVAPRDGQVLFSDPTGWTGRPVVTGERVMVLARPGELEIEAWLAPADAIPLLDGSAVTVYLSADPLQPIHARLRRIGHEPVQHADGRFGFPVRATIETAARAGRPLQVGLTGTARFEGPSVPLVYWVFRRPLAAVRTLLGI